MGRGGGARALGEPLGGSGSAGTVACLGSFLSGLFSRFVVCLSFPLYQFPGTIFDAGGAISVRSSSSHSSHPSRLALCLS